MGTKIRVDHTLDDLDDWSEQLTDDDEVAQTRSALQRQAPSPD